MQKIFYNASVDVLGKNNCQAFLVNDGKIVFTGLNDELLQMKNQETELVDLNGKSVFPAFFDTNINVYKIVEDRIKNAKKDQFLEKNDEFDENYEIFDNYNVYKAEFLELQSEMVSKGILTIQEIDISPKEFIFWKKISEEDLLKIDVIAYVDFFKNKQLMDNNCRSYRKYRKHFRLGGYVVNIDGEIIKCKAWMKKPYKGSTGSCGYASVYEEQLEFVIKTALEEKKQILAYANGDRALDQFLRVFDRVVQKEKFEEFCRPVVHSYTDLSKKQIDIIKKYGIAFSYDIEDVVKNLKSYKRLLGHKRTKNLFPAKTLHKNNLQFLIHHSRDELFDFSNASKVIFERNKKFNHYSKVEFNLNLQMLFAKFAFDDELKGSIEEGKLANFLVLDNESGLDFNASMGVYKEGERQ